MAGGGLENRIAQAVFGIPGVKGIEFGDGFAASEPITFRVAVKPTSSIAIEQDSVNLQTGENARLRVQGRHDPCLYRAPRRPVRGGRRPCGLRRPPRTLTEALLNLDGHVAVLH